jgi:hypothetical protein
VLKRGEYCTSNGGGKASPVIVIRGTTIDWRDRQSRFRSRLLQVFGMGKDLTIEKFEMIFRLYTTSGGDW